MDKQIKVKIVSCGGDLYWYKKQIGETFNVVKHDNPEKFKVVWTQWLISKCDCVIVDDEQNIREMIETTKETIESNKRILIKLEESLEELNSIKLEDVVVGNVFEGDGSLLIITPIFSDAQQKLTLTGLRNDPTMAYYCNARTQGEMFEYLKTLEAKKTNKKMVMVEV